MGTSTASKPDKKEEKQNNAKVFSIRISLKGISPTIWRRVEVPYNFTLHELHMVIQAAMGWENYHLYDFTIGKTHFSVPSDDWPSEDEDSEKTYINKLVFIGKSATMTYEYDFGDDWIHTVKIDKILPENEDVDYPRCVSGKRACPPEDSGGPYGYLNMLNILEDPKNEEYNDIKEWIGEDFDPEYFNLEEANDRVNDYLDMDYGF